MKKAILFDLDGLLVDTETLGIDVAVRVCKGLGIELTKTEQKSFIGVTDERFYQELFNKRNCDFDVQEILKKHFSLYEELLKTSLKPFPGACDLLKVLKRQGYKLGLVSGSTTEQINIILDKLKIKTFFNVIVSCEDITKSKPNPEGYLIASKKLRISPENCVVLEDAETGVIAGKKARMKVIGVTNNGGQDLSSADIIVKNLMELVNRDKEFWARALNGKYIYIID
ncbi:HAD family phosphatase [Candidatus Woesearchaeota archaeon]|nr:HAD family phosphatase [Candidatus Woesearchaeota archaeon]